MIVVVVVFVLVTVAEVLVVVAVIMIIIVMIVILDNDNNNVKPTHKKSPFKPFLKKGETSIISQGQNITDFYPSFFYLVQKKGGK